MKLINIILGGLSLVLATPCVSVPALSKRNIDRTFKLLEFEIPIRVLLEEAKTSDVHWSLGSSEGMVVYIPDTKEKIVFKGTTLSVTYKNNSFYFNGQKQTATHLFVMPLTGLIRNGSIEYDGVFSITKVKDVAYLVNHLDIEEYLASVLPYESIHGWPDAFQEAFCIVCRSYGIYKVLEQRELQAKNRWPYPYDIKSTIIHQVYRGHERTECFKRIVQNTRGIVLAYKEKPINAMYHLACGGIVPANKGGVHFEKAPYIERTYACNYCRESKFYRWDASFTFQELELELKKEIPQLGMLRDIKVSSYDDAGVAQQVKIRGSHRWFLLPASKFRTLFPKVRSLAFTSTRKGTTLTVQGKGRGHHLGLCQWGACFLAKIGWDYKRILLFYYPNTYFMKLTKVP